MRSLLIFAAICVGLAVWLVSAFAPGGADSLPIPPISRPMAAPTVAETISLRTARFTGQAPEPSTPSRRTTLQSVIDAALSHRVPVGFLLAIWQRECSSATICKTGDRGQSYGSFQVQEVAALRAGCVGKWRVGAGNPECAARILAGFYAERRTWRRALAAYKSPAHRWDKPNAYVMEIETIMRQWALNAGQGG